MDNNQSQPKTDLPAKPVIVENKPETLKPTAAPANKPADAAKTGAA